MIRTTVLVLIALLSLGCHDSTRGQQAAGRQPQRVEAPAPDEIATGRRNAITRAVEVVAPAVVSINVIEVREVQYRDPFNDPWLDFFFGQRPPQTLQQQVQGVGSGFVISPDGYIVTNDHVAGNATKITVALPDGRTLDARLVGSDPVTDVALLKVEPESPLAYLAFGDSENILVGEWAIALGNPFGLFEAAEPSVTVGVVSATGRDFAPQEGRVYRGMIQTDAAINRGNSGGPLVNAQGEVIGMNTFIFSQSGGSVGLGFAVPSARVQQIVRELQSKGRIDRPNYTGLNLVDVNPQVARALRLEDPTGVVVVDMDRNSPADRAGFQRYDVIVAINGQPVASYGDYEARVLESRAGDRVPVTIIREGRRQELSLRLERRS